MYPSGYFENMYRIQQTDVFATWLAALRNSKARARILGRLESARLGHLGDTKPMGGGIREMRVHLGPGYRVYFTRRGGNLLLLLCGGEKSTQSRDVERARRLLEVLRER